VRNLIVETSGENIRRAKRVNESRAENIWWLAPGKIGSDTEV
jgi:hypothetical protein